MGIVADPCYCDENGEPQGPFGRCPRHGSAGKGGAVLEAALKEPTQSKMDKLPALAAQFFLDGLEDQLPETIEEKWRTDIEAAVQKAIDSVMKGGDGG